MKHNTHKHKVVLTKTLLALFYVITFSPLHAQHFRFNYTDQFDISNLTSDSAKVFFNRKRYIAISEKDTSALIESLIAISSINRTEINFGAAFDLAGEALFLANEYHDPVLAARSHEEFGILNYIFKQNQTAGLHFKKSLSHYNDAYQQGLIPESELFYPNYYLVINYHHMNRNDSLKTHINKCYSILDNTDIDPVCRVFLDTERAIILYLNNNFLEAEQILNKSEKILVKFDDNNTSSQLYKRFLLDIYFSFARLYELSNNINQAKSYYEKALKDRKLNGEQVFSISYINSKYASFLHKIGEYEKAYSYLDISKWITDTYLNPRRLKNQEYLSVKNKYREELRQKDKELSRKNL